MNSTETLSIVIPAYNEEQRLPATLDGILWYLLRSPVPVQEVLVVDDGSRDGTAAMVEKAASTNELLRLVKNPGNRGKGYAVRNGMRLPKAIGFSRRTRIFPPRLQKSKS